MTVLPDESDPDWKAVLEQTASIPSIPMGEYLGRLGEVHTFVSDTLALYSNARSALVGKSTALLPTFLEFVEFPEGTTPEQRDQAVDKLKTQFAAKAEEQAAKYDVWVLNQGVVALCTTLDAFLEALVDATLHQKKELLYAAAPEKTIDLKTVAAAASVDELIAEVRQRVIRDFAWNDIEKRFAFIERYLHILSRDIFAFGSFAATLRSELAGWDLDRLRTIYGQRHEIVHRSARPFTGADEIATIARFFNTILLQISFLVSKKHTVVLDMFLWQARGDLFRQRKGQPPKSS